MASSSTTRKKRSLILAGGGLKVAFQAGVLQVWLDEAGIRFDHVDGASGGAFNLAMLCQGMSGTQIADNWRRTSPLAGVSPNFKEYLRLGYARSLFTLDGYRKNVFASWGLDWESIRRSRCKATFNVYNVSRQRLEVLTPPQMSEDYLVACVSLPMWFPPVQMNGNTYIDAVYATDANLDEAIRRGADEIWVIWTVSRRGEWHEGFVADYFQIIEAAANSQFERTVQRIERNNADIAAGRRGEFGRPIELKVLQAEVPINYVVNLGADRLHEVVNRGVHVAREWCARHGIPGSAPATEPAPAGSASLAFDEVMKGSIELEDAYPGGRGDGRNGAVAEVSLRLTIDAQDMDRFVTDPDHEARVSGEVVCERLGGSLPVLDGRFNLLVDDGDPAHKEMRYHLHFRDGEGRPLALAGVKTVRGESIRHLWSETTTLYTRVIQENDGPGRRRKETVVGVGVLSLHPLDFLRELTTFRVTGSSAKERIEALTRFGSLFAGKLWDVYARGVLTYGPV